jgi:hypothetical protein
MLEAQTARLKIVVSPVRVRVSPSETALEIRAFLVAAARWEPKDRGLFSAAISFSGVRPTPAQMLVGPRRCGSLKGFTVNGRRAAWDVYVADPDT